MMRTLNYLFIFLLLFSSCNTDINSSKEILNKFQSNRNKFDLLLSNLKSNPAIDSLFSSENNRGRKIDAFPTEITSTLSQLGISDVYLHYGCGKPSTKIFVFKTTWNSKTPIIIDNNPCDSLRVINGYYSKDENGNEFWGCGNSWQVYKETKVITVDQ